MENDVEIIQKVGNDIKDSIDDLVYQLKSIKQDIAELKEKGNKTD
jgi:hypothetical protein